MTDFIKRASANQVIKLNKIYMQGISETTVGLGRLYGPLFIIDGYDLKVIGTKIICALNESKQGIPHPTKEDYANADKNEKDLPILKDAGVKTWKAFMKIAQDVLIECEGHAANFTPTRFTGKSFQHLPEKSLTSDLDPENLGRTLLKAFELCE